MEDKETKKYTNTLQKLFNEGVISAREYTEGMFAREYVTQFNHGTDGHIRLTLIYKTLCELAKDE